MRPARSTHYSDSLIAFPANGSVEFCASPFLRRAVASRLLARVRCKVCCDRRPADPKPAPAFAQPVRVFLVFLGLFFLGLSAAA